jgi:hypothetical protein
MMARFTPPTPPSGAYILYDTRDWNGTAGLPNLGSLAGYHMQIALRNGSIPNSWEGANVTGSTNDLFLVGSTHAPYAPITWADIGGVPAAGPIVIHYCHGSNPFHVDRTLNNNYIGDPQQHAYANSIFSVYTGLGLENDTDGTTARGSVGVYTDNNLYMLDNPSYFAAQRGFGTVVFNDGVDESGIASQGLLTYRYGALYTYIFDFNTQLLTLYENVTRLIGRAIIPFTSAQLVSSISTFNFNAQYQPDARWGSYDPETDLADLRNRWPVDGEWYNFRGMALTRSTANIGDWYTYFSQPAITQYYIDPALITGAWSFDHEIDVEPVIPPGPSPIAGALLLYDSRTWDGIVDYWSNTNPSSDQMGILQNIGNLPDTDLGNSDIPWSGYSASYGYAYDSSAVMYDAGITATWEEFGGLPDEAPFVAHLATGPSGFVLYGLECRMEFYGLTSLRAEGVTNKYFRGWETVPTYDYGCPPLRSSAAPINITEFDLRFAKTCDYSWNSSTDFRRGGTYYTETASIEVNILSNGIYVRVSKVGSSAYGTTFTGTAFNLGAVMAFRVTWSNTNQKILAYIKFTSESNAVADCQSDSDWIPFGTTTYTTYQITTLFDPIGLEQRHLYWMGPAKLGGSVELMTGRFFYGQFATAINGTPIDVVNPNNADNWFKNTYHVGNRTYEGVPYHPQYYGTFFEEAGEVPNWAYIEPTTGNTLTFSQAYTISFFGFHFEVQGDGSADGGPYNDKYWDFRMIEIGSTTTNDPGIDVPQANTLYSLVLDFVRGVSETYMNGSLIYTESLSITAEDILAIMPDGMSGGVLAMTYDREMDVNWNTPPVAGELWPGIGGMGFCRDLDFAAWYEHFYDTTMPVVIYTVSTAFKYTGSVQQFTVPAGVTRIRIVAYGGSGGAAYSNASGRGGRVSAIFSVTPGQVLDVYVGQGSTSLASVDAGGWPNGGKGGISTTKKGYGGGGSSHVIPSGGAFTNALIVAGGGGGAAASGTERNHSNSKAKGGYGGWTNGYMGMGRLGTYSPAGGGGGTDIAGGLAGEDPAGGEAGDTDGQGVGGHAPDGPAGSYPGGGGGGGWHGGGAGGAPALITTQYYGCDGGGGSGYIHPSGGYIEWYDAWTYAYGNGGVWFEYGEGEWYLVPPNAGCATGTGLANNLVPPIVDNNMFADAVVLSFDGNSHFTLGNNTGATTEAGEPYDTWTGHNSIWWKFTAPFTGTVTIDTFASGSVDDTVLHLFSAGIPDTLANLVLVTYDDDTPGPYGQYQSQIITTVTSGVLYYIRVMGYGASDVGVIQLNYSGPV